MLKPGEDYVLHDQSEFKKVSKFHWRYEGFEYGNQRKVFLRNCDPDDPANKKKKRKRNEKLENMKREIVRIYKSKRNDWRDILLSEEFRCRNYKKNSDTGCDLIFRIVHGFMDRVTGELILNENPEFYVREEKKGVRCGHHCRDNVGEVAIAPPQFVNEQPPQNIDRNSGTGIVPPPNGMHDTNLSFPQFFHREVAPPVFEVTAIEPDEVQQWSGVFTLLGKPTRPLEYFNNSRLSPVLLTNKKEEYVPRVLDVSINRVNGEIKFVCLIEDDQVIGTMEVTRLQMTRGQQRLPDFLCTGYKPSFEVIRRSQLVRQHERSNKNKKRKWGTCSRKEFPRISSIKVVEKCHGPIEGGETVHIYFSLSHDDYFNRLKCNIRMIGTEECFFGRNPARVHHEVSEVDGIKGIFFKLEREVPFDTDDRWKAQFVAVVDTPKGDQSGLVDVSLRLNGALDTKLDIVLKEGYLYDGGVNEFEDNEDLSTMKFSEEEEEEEDDEEFGGYIPNFDDDLFSSELGNVDFSGYDEQNFDTFQDKFGASLLFYAVAQNRMNFVKYLVGKRGFDVRKKDVLGYTALDIALEFKRNDISTYLYRKMTGQVTMEAEKPKKQQQQQMLPKEEEEEVGKNYTKWKYTCKVCEGSNIKQKNGRITHECRGSSTKASHVDQPLDQLRMKHMVKSSDTKLKTGFHDVGEDTTSFLKLGKCGNGSGVCTCKCLKGDVIARVGKRTVYVESNFQ